MKRNLFSITFVPFLIFTSCALASSQTSGGTIPERIGNATQATAADFNNRTSADENFELNIAERRITESGFAASTSIEVGEETARGLLLRVGVSLGADEISVLLRNVQGRVRFHGTLERVLERLSTHRASGAVP